MQNYDFSILSPPEFENLTRDLLQKEFNVFIESFKDGPDGGIDLRFAKANSKNIIVQCKRYKDFKSLFQSLKKEVSKVKKLKPSRYIVATSVGLNPAQKEKIFTLFTPYIKSNTDIIGKDDLNNLLGRHKDIELKYIKLWLSSINVLNKILHSKIYNQSRFELDEIDETIKLYVKNNGFYEANQILNKHHFVIISGIPGIGKTTLARILILYLLSHDFEEFIFLDNISEAYTFYNTESKQVFLFDDFLGRNFLETSKPSSEETSIVKFIDKIKKSKNKRLIFTTREYILKQAKSKYELFGRAVFDKTKCVIDLSKYTKIVKAQILYNHLYYSELPPNYVIELLKEKFYLKLISHSNYNPRIIETIVKSEIWEDTEPSNFRDSFKSYFDYPESIWKHAYDSHISNLSRCMLALMLTAGTPILYTDLMLLVQNFAQKLSNKYNIAFSEKEYKKSLKELENSFIKISKGSKDKIAIEYQNPSIQDFLVNYLNTELDLIKDIIDTAIFVNQLFRVFSFQPKKRRNQIIIKGELINFYFNKVENDLDKLKSSRILKFSYNSSKESDFYWSKKYYTISEKLALLINDLLIDKHPDFKNFIKKRYLAFVHSEDFELEHDELYSFIKILKIFKNDIKLDKNIFFERITQNFYFYDDLSSFKQIESIYPKDYFSFIETNEKFQNILYHILQNEYDNANEHNYEEVIEALEEMENDFGVLVYHELDELIKQQELDYEMNYHYDKDEWYERKSENKEIESIFETLKTKE